jgi:hypothetical protein
MSKKVLVVAMREASREPAYITSKVLSENGYSTATCNAEHESAIHPDVTLSKDTSLDGYEGLIFIDDGGDADAAIALAKKAESDTAIGGLSPDGCLILSAAGKFKDHHVCAGLPKEAYDGAEEQVDAPSVRSDNLVTGVGDCANGFAFLMVDALGGKVKRIVESEEAEEVVVADEEFSEKVVEAIRNLKGKKASARDMFRRGAVHQFGEKTVFGRGDIALASKDGEEYEIITPEGTDSVAERVSVRVVRGNDGWQLSGPSRHASYDELAIDTAIVAQAMAEDPEGMDELEVVMLADDSGPDVQSVSKIPCNNHGEKDRHYYLERDLGAEGIFLQPDGGVAIKLPSGTKKLGAEDALEFMAKAILESSSREMDDIERNGSPDPWNDRSSRRHRHVLRCLIGLLSDIGAISWPMSETVRTAAVGKFADKGYSVGGANFGLSTDNLDITTRVYPYKEEEDYLNDKDKFVKNLGRYNPEYINTPDPTTWGVYYVWDEQRRDPYSWYRRFTDGVYPFNEALKP